MKKILLAYALIGLVLLAFLAVSSYGYGSGYLYLQWRDLHIQTTLWFAVIATLLMSLLVQLFWVGIAKRSLLEKRKTDHVMEFQALHPYEQLGMVWLLNAALSQKSFIETKFQPSALLKELMTARLAYLSGHYDAALAELNKSQPALFELAELQKIEIYLAQQDIDQAYTHLVFLSQHHLSPWLVDVEDAYQHRLKALWGQFAIVDPWRYLSHYEQMPLLQEDQFKWLSMLLKHIDVVTPDQAEQLLSHYQAEREEISQRDIEQQILWLKLWVHLAPNAAEVEQLANHLLSQRLNHEVLHIWLHWQMSRPEPDLQQVEAYIDVLEQQYSLVPALALARCYLYEKQNRVALLQQIFDQYPDDVYIHYYKLKHALGHDESLVRSLNKIFETDFNYLKIIE